MLPDDKDKFPDKELIIEELLDKYGSEVKRLAFLYVKDTSLAEDIMQEVFIACYKSLDSFKGESSYRTWLIRITINKSKDALRKWSFKNLVYKSSIFIKDSKTPESISFQKIENGLLMQRILELPLKYRELILLYYYQELTIEEICKITKLNVNTIKTRLHRARKILNNTIKEGDFIWREI
ncbi:sigma-70 family RNA polymerase sigma factor [Bacillus sp. BGMRC 2118]|nr:sigma-70 family RNA polymerase sigma factor [Bacillus sp. BGMRC 2118]